MIKITSLEVLKTHIFRNGANFITVIEDQCKNIFLNRIFGAWKEKLRYNDLNSCAQLTSCENYGSTVVSSLFY